MFSQLVCKQCHTIYKSYEILMPWCMETNFLNGPWKIAELRTTCFVLNISSVCTKVQQKCVPYCSHVALEVTRKFDHQPLLQKYAGAFESWKVNWNKFSSAVTMLCLFWDRRQPINTINIIEILKSRQKLGSISIESTHLRDCQFKL